MMLRGAPMVILVDGLPDTGTAAESSRPDFALS